MRRESDNVHSSDEGSSYDSLNHSDGEVYLCEYEKERLQNIKENQEMLKILGTSYNTLLGTAFNTLSSPQVYP